MGIMITIVIGFFIILVVNACEYLVYKYIIDKFAPPTYRIHSYETTPDSTNVYRMRFYLTDDVIKEGYTKKCPPAGTLPEQLTARIRTFHPKRCSYRLFWKLKTSK